MAIFNVYITSATGTHPVEFNLDLEPPIIINEDPAPNEAFVPIIHNLISFDVIDEYYGVILQTLDAYVDGYLAFNNGSFQYPFDGPDSYVGAIAPFDSYEGYAFVFDCEYLWTADDQIDIRVIAEDARGNIGDNTWHFYTPEIIPPKFENLDPAANATKISVSEEFIEFDVVSTSKTKIFGNSIDAYVNGNLVFDNEAFDSPFNGLDAYYGPLITIEGYDGYKVRLDYINTPWQSYQLVNVRMRAQDAYGFWADEIYSFRIEDIEEPIFADVYPGPGTGSVDRDTPMWADFYDTGSGIDAYAIDAYVNDVCVYDGNFIPTYDGPLSGLTPKVFDSYDGYRLTIDKVGSFNSGEIVSVRVTVRDKEGN